MSRALFKSSFFRTMSLIGETSSSLDVGESPVILCQSCRAELAQRPSL